MERTTDVLVLPPSTTGRVGVISRATLELCAALRASGVCLAIVSGARTATLLTRLPFLPAADAYVSENGGRIFYPAGAAPASGVSDGGGGPAAAAAAAAAAALPTACPLVEDLEWRALLAPVAGPPRQEATPPEQRAGALWDHYRALAAAGWRLDALGYATAFRLHAPPAQEASTAAHAAPDVAAAAAASAARPACLKASVNLGVLDFYPAAAGKEGAAAHLLARWGGAPHCAAHLCDDDNDLPLARMVARAFLPRVAEASVAAAAAADPARFVVATARHTAATEEMLRAAAAFFAELQRTGGAARLEAAALAAEAAAGRAAATAGAEPARLHEHT